MISWVTAAKVGACSVGNVMATLSSFVIAADRPIDRGRACEIAGVGKARHHHDVAGVDLAVVDRRLQVRGYPHGEEVSAPPECVTVPLARKFKCLGPVAQQQPVGLIGDQQVEVGRFDPDAFAHRVHDLRHLPVAPRAPS